MILWLAVRRKAILHKANRRKTSSWKLSDYYRLFFAGLDAASRSKFLAHTEQEQYRLYIEWTLREGLRANEKQRNM